MTPPTNFRVFLCVLLTTIAGTAPGFAQLEEGLKAHGTLAKWNEFSGVQFETNWAMARGVRKDQHLFNLRSRDGLVTSEGYTIGCDRGEVWVRPNPDAVGMPPRFYLWTPFYFFGMPFVFADPGAQQEALGKRTIAGVEYDVVKLTFAKGTGDSPEDYYIAHFEAKTRQLKIVAYIVTYPELLEKRPVAEQKPHAIVFEEWQEADGLLVPKTGKLFDWVNDNVAGDPRGTLEFSKVKFSRAAPDQAKFVRATDAVVVPLK